MVQELSCEYLVHALRASRLILEVNDVHLVYVLGMTNYRIGPHQTYPYY